MNKILQINRWIWNDLSWNVMFCKDRSTSHGLFFFKEKIIVWEMLISETSKKQSSEKENNHCEHNDRMTDNF